MNDTLEIMRAFAEELYFRAQAAKTKDERQTIKGIQHSLERVLARYEAKTFDRPTASQSPDDLGLPPIQRTL